MAPRNVGGGRWSSPRLVLTAMSALLVACGVTRVVEGEAGRKASMNPATVQSPPAGANAFSVAGRGDCLSLAGGGGRMRHTSSTAADKHRVESLPRVVDLSPATTARTPRHRATVEIRTG